MNDSLEDFDLPVKPFRKPFAELSSNVFGRSNPQRSQPVKKLKIAQGKAAKLVEKSECSEKAKKDASTQSVAVCTQDAGVPVGFAPASYKKFDKDRPLTYRSLVTSVISSKEATLEFCFDMGLIPRQKMCPTCGSPMKLLNDCRVWDGHRWYCRVRKGKHRHEHRLSLRTGTFFQQSNLTLEEMLQIMYLWMYNSSQKHIEHELGISSQTDVDWNSFCREICETSIIRGNEKIGGPDIVVEIDESKFAKRKYNVGHRVVGGWVFGGRERDNKSKIFMNP